MAETTITIHIDPKLKAAFSQAAEARNRTDDDLLREFIEDYIESQRTDAEYDEWFRRQVQLGIEEADAGDFISAAEIEAEFAVLRDTSRVKLPRSA